MAEVAGHPQQIVDGLQRFATLTTLLYELYPLVLTHPPLRPAAASSFAAIAAQCGPGQFPLLEWNVNAMTNHRRQIIRETFSRYRTAMREYVESQVNATPAEFGRMVESMCRDRKVAIDTWMGFARSSELTNTFVALNSQGIELSSIDMLRATIVDRAQEQRWSDADVDSAENDFTETFTNPKAPEVYRTVSKVLNVMLERRPTSTQPRPQSCVFPDWTNFDPSQLDVLLDYLSQTATNSFPPSNFVYLKEIRETSAAAYAVFVLYNYWRQLETGIKPDFTGGGADSTRESHSFLRAAYRRLIDGSIFRLGDVVVDLIGASTIPSFDEVLSKVNPDSSGSISSPPDSQWLSVSLALYKSVSTPRN